MFIRSSFTKHLNANSQNMSQFYTGRQLWRRIQCRRRSNKPLPPVIKDETKEESSIDIPPPEDTNSGTTVNVQERDNHKEVEEKINEIESKTSPRKVTFAPFVSVYKVPSLVDLIAFIENENKEDHQSFNPSNHHDLYWTSRDYEVFKQDAILEIRTFWKLFGKSNTVTKNPTAVLYQPSTNSDDALQRDFIYELITLSKHSNSPQYYTCLSNALTTLFDSPEVKEKLFTTPMMNTSFLRHVDTLSRLEDFISDEAAYPISEAEKEGCKVLPYYGDEDDEDDEDLDTVTTKASEFSLSSTPPDRHYPSSLILGECDHTSCSDISPCYA